VKVILKVKAKYNAGESSSCTESVSWFTGEIANAEVISCARGQSLFPTAVGLPQYSNDSSSEMTHRIVLLLHITLLCRYKQRSSKTFHCSICSFSSFALALLGAILLSQGLLHQYICSSLRRSFSNEIGKTYSIAHWISQSISWYYSCTSDNCILADNEMPSIHFLSFSHLTCFQTYWGFELCWTKHLFAAAWDAAWIYCKSFNKLSIHPPCHIGTQMIAMELSGLQWAWRVVARGLRRAATNFVNLVRSVSTCDPFLSILWMNILSCFVHDDSN
jgi:hypothetical protein